MTKTRNQIQQPPFLPMTRAEMARLDWPVLDVLLITGDGYIDHPAFGAALLGRWLVANGFRVGLVSQPRWDDTTDVERLGRPRLFAGVTAGALDSMLAHYTAFRKKRHDDAYTPGGEAGARPNRATLVYTGLARRAFPGLPVVIGGIEASMRRAAHYDFWSDAVRRSLLLDSKADLLVYGMAERPILQIAQRLADMADGEAGLDPPRVRDRLHGIPGTVYAGTDNDAPANTTPVPLPSFEEIQADPAQLMAATLTLERQVHNGSSWAAQRTETRTTFFAPPAPPLSSTDLDAVYGLPFSRATHPVHPADIPAASMIRFSVTTHRGCAGGCSFCSLALHQGRRIRSRTQGAILSEVEGMTHHPDWRGSLSDVGGPSANMWATRCTGDAAGCRRESCLFPTPCRHLESRQPQLVGLLRAIAAVPRVKHLRTASGVRFDLALTSAPYLKALVSDFVGGQLKVAPEHKSDHVLKLMRKPPFKVFEQFLEQFERHSRASGKEQYVVPYLLSAFPGCTDADMRDLANWLRNKGWTPQQVQCFVPTPGTVATAMFHAGIDPEGHPIHIARTDAERLRQHGMLTGGERHPRKGRKPRS